MKKILSVFGILFYSMCFSQENDPKIKVSFLRELQLRDM